MTVNYILEMVVLNEFEDYQTWRWKQIAIAEDIEQLKRLCSNRHRILDAHTLDEVYRTASMYNSELMAIVSGY